MIRQSEARRFEREASGWRELVHRYISEIENPAPDYTMRRILRDQMRNCLTDPSRLPLDGEDDT